MSAGGSAAVVIDTNIFVGAAFSPDSASGRVVQAVRDGRLLMPWSDATRGEVEAVVRKIPPIAWDDIADLFREQDRRDGGLDMQGLDWVGDPADRKFAALARATDAILVSNDDHLLARRDEASIVVLTSGEFRDRLL